MDLFSPIGLALGYVCIRLHNVTMFEIFARLFVRGANARYVARWSGDAQEGGLDCKVTRDAEQHSEEVDAIEERQDKE